VAHSIKLQEPRIIHQIKSYRAGYNNVNDNVNNNNDSDDDNYKKTKTVLIVIIAYLPFCKRMQLLRFCWHLDASIWVSLYNLHQINELLMWRYLGDAKTTVFAFVSCFSPLMLKKN